MTRRQARPYPIPPTLTALVDPRLTGAACSGRAPMFDAELEEESIENRSSRLGAAARICSGCPVQAGCAVVATEAGRHAEGVWAGRIPAPRPLGRPRKDLSA